MRWLRKLNPEARRSSRSRSLAVSLVLRALAFLVVLLVILASRCSCEAEAAGRRAVLAPGTSSLPGLLTCPGCSMYDLFVEFLHPEHARWAWLIVAGMGGIPLLLYFAGFRPGPRRSFSPVRRGVLAALLFSGWCAVVAGGPNAPNFGIALLHWIHLPMVIQWNVAVGFLWGTGLGFLYVLPLWVAPAAWCWWLSRWLVLRDRRITFGSSAAPAGGAIEVCPGQLPGPYARSRRPVE